MLFIKYLRDGIRAGAITSTVRIWHQPRVSVGKRYRLEGGAVEVDSITQIAIEDLTDDIARACGFKTVADLLRVARHGSGENVYLITFHYVPRAD